MEKQLQWHPGIRKRLFIGIALLLLVAAILDLIVSSYSAPLFRASTIMNHVGFIRALSQRLVLQTLHHSVLHPANQTTAPPSEQWNSPISLERELRNRLEEIAQYLDESRNTPEFDAAHSSWNHLDTLSKAYISALSQMRVYEANTTEHTAKNTAENTTENTVNTLPPLSVRDSLRQDILRQSGIVLAAANDLVQKTEQGFNDLGYRSRVLKVLSNVILTTMVIVLSVLLMHTTANYNRLYREERVKTAYLHSLLDNVHLYVFRVNKHGHYTYQNKTFAEKFTAVQGETTVSNSIQRILMPEDGITFQRTIEECFKHPATPIRETLCLVSESGKSRMCNWECIAILDTNGEVSEVQFVGEDISDYLSVSEQEQTTQTNLQAVFDASIQSMWLLDTHLNVLSCNRLAASAIQTIFGKDPGIGESIFEYILPEQRQEVNINMQKALQGERIVHEAEFNGLWFEYQYAPVYNKRQEIIGITLTALDISLLKTSIRQLEQQQHFLETILAAIPGGIYIYDTTQNRNIYASPSITNVLGYSPTELQAMGENFLFHHVHEDDIPRIIGHLQEIQLSTVEQEATIEYRFRHKDGSWIWLSSKDVVFVRDSGGTIVQFLGMVSDITKKKEVEMEIIHLNEVLEYRVEERTKRLADLNREKDEILSIAAHDLKNPIAGIRTGAEIITMLAAKQSFDKIEQYTRLTIGACETMVDIINNLLDVGKLESGTMTMNLQPTSLSVVQQIIDANQEIALRKGIMLHQDIDASLVIRADEKAFRQVLDNMISNAIKYSQPWHPVYVSTAVHSKGNTRTVRISVRDEGPGLSEDDKTKLFGKFARLSAVPTAGESSTGLGLSIVKKLVELQHGQVWCDSELGQGATFTVELPMLQK